MTTIARAPTTPWATNTTLMLPYSGSRLLAASGVSLLLMMVPTTLAALLDPRLLNEINIWIKPLKFQFSLALHLLTVALGLLLLPEPVRRGRTVAILAWALVASALFEVVYIAWQASRGSGSHFNRSSPFTAMMYNLMGVGSTILVAAAAWVGTLILRHGDRKNLIVLGTGLGFIIGAALGGVTGFWMSAKPGHWVGTAPSDAQGLWLVGWSRSGGDLRVAHFFGMHMMQALPLAALLLSALPARPGRWALYGSAFAGTALTLATFVQAVRGIPLIPL